MLSSCSNLWRTTSEEKRAQERLEKPMYNEIRQAAEVHRQVHVLSHRLGFSIVFRIYDEDFTFEGIVNVFFEVFGVDIVCTRKI